jgi:hypothetical protein
MELITDLVKNLSLVDFMNTFESKNIESLDFFPFSKSLKRFSNNQKFLTSEHNLNIKNQRIPTMIDPEDLY